MKQRTTLSGIATKKITSGLIVALFLGALLLACGSFHDCDAERKATEDCTLAILLATLAQSRTTTSSSTTSTSAASTSATSTLLLGGLFYCGTLTSSACAADE